MEFEIALYCSDEGDSPIADFLDDISEKELSKVISYVRLLAEFGNHLTSQYIKHISGDLWELRPEFGGTEMRFFYFTWVDNLIVIVHAVKKKSRKIPRAYRLANDRIKEVKDGEAPIVQLILG